MKSSHVIRRAQHTRRKDNEKLQERKQWAKARAAKRYIPAAGR